MTRFQTNTRVRLNHVAWEQGIARKRFPSNSVSGVVKGHSRDGILVLFDDNEVAHWYPERFFDPEPPQPAPGFAGGGKFNPKFLGNPLQQTKGTI